MYKLLFFVLSLYLSHEGIASLNYSQIGIVDDVIANSIRPPRPPSVSDLLADIEKQQLNNITNLDISFNNITSKGALKILEFAQRQVPNLKSLDLSYNRIHFCERDESYLLDFVIPFNALRRRSVLVNLEGNDIRIDKIINMSFLDTDQDIIPSH